MEKLRLVGSASLWLEMRNIRNRIVHDYLPEQTAQMFDLICQNLRPRVARGRQANRWRLNRQRQGRGLAEIWLRDVLVQDLTLLHV